MKSLLALVAVLLAAPKDELWVVYEGGEGPGKGKHVVLISGDEEYRSEEALPQLGKILAKHHGFKCTVLFAINKGSGEIDPNAGDNIPGTEALRTADLMIVALRFRHLPAEQMKPIDEYVNSGKPIIGLRTATHSFDNKGDDPYARYGWTSKVPGWEKGFGKQVLGETWVNHHGSHGKESTRGRVAPGQEKNPIVKGCEDIWGPTDVYTVNLPLPGDSTPLILGQVLRGMKPEDPPVEGKKNDPLMPVAWTKSWAPAEGKKARIFTTTMGSSTDLECEGLRRLLVNASYWCLGMEDRIADRAKVDVVGDYVPTPFGFNKAKKGVKPSDHRM
jgi:type 1 glutamine amidotransferase